MASTKYRLIDAMIAEFREACPYEQALQRALAEAEAAEIARNLPYLTDHGHKPPKLPAELWDKILEKLSRKDVKAVRSAWRSWTAIGIKFLFNPFVFRPDRDDFARFDHLSQAPGFTSVHSLRFELGTLPLVFAPHNLGWAYCLYVQSSIGVVHSSRMLVNLMNTQALLPRVWERIILHLGGGKNSNLTEFLPEQFLAHYAAWNVRWHEAKQPHGNVQRLGDVLSKMKSVSRIDISYKTCPFDNVINMEAWTQGTLNHNYAKTVQELDAIFQALKKSPHTINHFSHDELPVSFFMKSSEHILQITAPLSQLATLHLSFDATLAPHASFWKGLGTCLQTIPGLQNLRFGFAPFPTGHINQVGWRGGPDRLTGQWYAPLWKILGNYTWKNLKTLRLDGMVLCETGLIQLFERHSNTLRSVELHNIGLWQGSFQVVFSYLRTLSLKAFKVRGYCEGLHHKSERWRFGLHFDCLDPRWSWKFREHIMLREEDMNDTGWHNTQWPEDGSDGFEPRSKGGVRTKLERFVLGTDLGHGEWPLDDSDSLMESEWNIHNVNCGDCVRTNDQIDKQWDEQLAIPLSKNRDWTATNASVPGVGEPRIVGFYDKKNGYDEFGFDRRGRDSTGDLMIKGFQRVFSWSGITVEGPWLHRLMREGILCRIPRYSKALSASSENVFQESDDIKKNLHWHV
ncbi:uncharacterized protein LY89DRAFT_790197 [Mollisia scopiformis]|uniref:F-box domain-containing protein n=1 Tax=Mollisia scopiformis TaxID=149040 RepID=A0A132B3I2_MOLSC|nr:uncharacterized protein LY89DRAFT_790197 [Mollisia scopiformis]KUJ06813.1 hypothetical protein LY89DRAFT_790197 [Mollisia scopiformis]